jgi:hypothetical protein
LQIIPFTKINQKTSKVDGIDKITRIYQIKIVNKIGKHYLAQKNKIKKNKSIFAIMMV